MTAWRPRTGEGPEHADRPALEAVLEHYGVLVSGRRRQMARCPFHEDRTPSCSIDLDKQVFNCHSCGKAGTSWDLIMGMEGITFERARTVAATLGLATDGSGRGGEQVSGSSYASRRRVPTKSGNQPRNSAYQPSWRRK